MLGAILILKIWLFLWGALFFPFADHRHETVFTIWARWDGRAYVTLATQWYTAAGIPPDYFRFLSHFPPLYPAAIALVGLLTRAPLPVAALLVSWAAILAASYFLYRLVKDDTGDGTTAVYSALFLNVWPTSYFTIAAYAESLFILLAVLCFYALRRRSFAWAGAAAAAAILTRLSGITLVPAFAVTLWRLHREKSPQRWPAAVYLLGVPALAVVTFLAINAVHYGDPLHFQRDYQTNPYAPKRLIVPFRETLDHFAQLLGHIPKSLSGAWMMVYGWNALLTLAAPVLVLIGIWMRLPSDYAIFALGSILLFASFSWGISNARYTLSIFPLFVVLARVRPLLLRHLLAGVCFFLLVYFTGVFTRGAWAF